MASEATSSETGDKSRGLAKVLEGIVTSSKMDKSVVVSVSTQKKHPQYGKYILRTNKYMAHDEENTCKEGDRVSIVACRPLSKNKRWRLKSVIERAV